MVNSINYFFVVLKNGLQIEDTESKWLKFIFTKLLILNSEMYMYN